MYENNIVRKLFRRQLRGDVNLKFQREQHVSRDCIRRLGLEGQLQGHQGCVNCLSWNEDGSLLMSGSDDLNLILWRATMFKDVATISTGHRGNIFSAKFMPHSGDNIVISGAADSEIRVHEVSRKETFQVLRYHSSRVKRIATSRDQPHIFWSASEDGTVMQFDLRDRDCFKSEDPRCVLIDLSSQVGTTMEVKCLSINPALSEMLAVGANDPYARIYDRRMLQCSSLRADRSTQNVDSLPRGCVRYYVAGHLPKKQSDYKRLLRTLACTYLAFSPDGGELLVNLGGEHIYLFDVYDSRRRQKLDSVLRSIRQTPHPMDCNGFKQSVHIQPSNGFSVGISSSRNGVNRPSEDPPSDDSRSSPTGDSFKVAKGVEEIRRRAKEFFTAQKYSQSINEYNLAISMAPSSVLYCNRALALSKRNWDGDIYAAMRDSLSAILLDDNNLKAHFRLAKCFLELSWLDEAKSCLELFQQKFSYSNSFGSLEAELKNAIKSKKTSEDSSPSSSSSSAGSTFRQREFASSDKISDDEKKYREQAFDYEQRFCGHCNTTTDIKEANFFGSNGDYIVAGSDDGHFFVWEKKSSNIVKAFVGDSSIVNCLEPHPSCCLLATSGIDSVVRLWSPRPDLQEEQPSENEEVMDVDEVAKANQQRMNKDPLEQMLVNMGYRITSPDPEGTGDYDQESPITCRTN